ncbi:MAG: hypothetical protein R2709_10940 [Marmoricola sp.]
MQERAIDPKIEFAWNSIVKSINGADRLESLTLEDTVTGPETRELDATGLFIAIGHDPRSSWSLAKSRSTQRDMSWCRGGAARPTSKASSPVVIWSITPTARPSLLPGQVAPQHWTQSAISATWPTSAADPSRYGGTIVGALVLNVH